MIVLVLRRMNEEIVVEFIREGRANDLKCLQFINIRIAR
jgi:hypothetical protein